MCVCACVRVCLRSSFCSLKNCDFKKLTSVVLGVLLNVIILFDMAVTVMCINVYS